MKKTITPREISDQLEVTISAVYYWIKVTRALKARRIGGRYNILLKDYKKFLKRGGIEI